MVYTALKNYERALYFFEVCITTPAMAMSHIMLEAYKKFLMVSLIVEGKVGKRRSLLAPVIVPSILLAALADRVYTKEPTDDWTPHKATGKSLP